MDASTDQCTRSPTDVHETERNPAEAFGKRRDLYFFMSGIGARFVATQLPRARRLVRGPIGDGSPPITAYYPAYYPAKFWL